MEVLEAAHPEREDGGGERGALNLGHVTLRKFEVRLLGKETKALARLLTAGAACASANRTTASLSVSPQRAVRGVRRVRTRALSSGRLGYGSGEQRVDAPCRMVHANLGEAGVDDVHDAVDGEGGLRNVRGKYHLARACRSRLERPQLHRRWQRRIQRMDRHLVPSSRTLTRRLLAANRFASAVGGGFGVELGAHLLEAGGDGINVLLPRKEA